jgi:hypothetical protein
MTLWLYMGILLELYDNMNINLYYRRQSYNILFIESIL